MLSRVVGPKKFVLLFRKDRLENNQLYGHDRFLLLILLMDIFTPFLTNNPLLFVTEE